MGNLHTAYDRGFFCSPFAKFSTEGSLTLSDMQIGLYDSFDPIETGLSPVLTLKGFPTTEKRLSIRQGLGERAIGRSDHNHTYSTPLFSLEEVEGVYASYPKEKDMGKEVVQVGYDGLNPDTAISARRGDRILFDITLEGRALELLNYPQGRFDTQATLMIPMADMIPDLCNVSEPCEPIELCSYVEDFVRQLRDTPLAGMRKMSDFVDIDIIKECGSKPSPSHTFSIYTLDICDAGDRLALAEVANQYPGVVIRPKYSDKPTSTYYGLFGNSPASYKKRTKSILPDACAMCPEGNPTPGLGKSGGYAYTLSIQDDGVNRDSEYASIFGTPPDLVKRGDGTNYGWGRYVVIVGRKLKKEDIAHIINTLGDKLVITFIGKVNDLCKDETVIETNWKLTNERFDLYYVHYEARIPETECADLQERLNDFYSPGYGEVLNVSTVANVNCMTNVRLTKYSSPNKFISDSCKQLLGTLLSAEPPRSMDGERWYRIIEDDCSLDCLLGIRFEGKELRFNPSICAMANNEIRYQEDGLRIAIKAGYPDQMHEGYNNRYNKPLNVQQMSRWTPRTHLGAHVVDEERIYHMYFTGESIPCGYVSQWIQNMLPKVKPGVQYADLAIRFKMNRPSNMPGQNTGSYMDFHFYVEYGAHEELVAELNKIAAAAGVEKLIVD